MKKCVYIPVLSAYAIIMMYSCKSNPAATPTLTSDTIHFYPVNEYFKDQVKSVNLPGAFIYKITIDNDSNSRDSSLLSKQQFNEWAQAFLEYDINDKTIHKYYKENVFGDETTQSYTFNYTAMDSTLPLQRVDILLATDDQHVKNVFINKVKTAGDSTIIEKAGWKTDNNFFINRIIEHPDNKTTTQQNIIVWRFQP